MDKTKEHLVVLTAHNLLLLLRVMLQEKTERSRHISSVFAAP